MSPIPITPSDVIFPYNRLFDWYDAHGRDLPWRCRWPDTPPIYHLWLSEIMLQQTVVKTVVPYFLDFIDRWPSVSALADASLDEILAAWAGLGYYARARNLHKTAKIVTANYGGVFPENETDLLALPGIGLYTANAILTMGFNKRRVVVDSNIERVIARFFSISIPLPKAKTNISTAYDRSCPEVRVSDFPQALMDLANACCKPKSPHCHACPIAEQCCSYSNGVAEQLPLKASKPIRSVRHGIALVAINQGGKVFMEQRPERGLFGGMTVFPSFGWMGDRQVSEESLFPEKFAPFNANWRKLPITVNHTFTHFVLKMTVYFAQVDTPISSSLTGWWQTPQPTEWPSLMRKIWREIKLSELKSK